MVDGVPQNQGLFWTSDVHNCWGLFSPCDFMIWFVLEKSEAHFPFKLRLQCFSCQAKTVGTQHSLGFICSINQVCYWSG